MPAFALARWTGAAALAALLTVGVSAPAAADTEYVWYGNLIGTATVQTPLDGGDNLFAESFVTERGALNQVTTFTLSEYVDFNGLAGWIVDPPAGQGPRLIGVNLDIVDSSANVVAGDTFTGVLGGFAHSSFLGSLGPGTYTLVATGNAVRDGAIDISLSFTSPIPEPATYGMLAGGLGVLALVARRRRQDG
ncbi:putative secreted protein [Pseudoduganella lurida]|uniref:Putative secreted protein n=1 Tax=Pseudoduganella lurida TaxID=1036180 RepID=A0A562RJJ0_9BURK|nr:FxDxF family PEP-CTERM protein [Pseudoduganella lurida]TWI69237.1 putative secreted protein [Pseudoduganella lurida]